MLVIGLLLANLRNDIFKAVIAASGLNLMYVITQTVSALPETH